MTKAKSIVVFVLSLLLQKGHAGCQNPYLYSTDGVKGWWSVNINGVIYLEDKTDTSTFVIMLLRGESNTQRKTVTNFAITFNGDTVFIYRGTIEVPVNPICIRLPVKAGYYKTSGSGQGCIPYNLNSSFEMKVRFKTPPPKVYVYSESKDTSTLGIISEQEPKPFSVYFNKNANNLIFENLGEGNKTITFYNMSGQLIESITTQENNTGMPLRNNLIGLYYVQVATQTEQTVIRKIFIQ